MKKFEHVLSGFLFVIAVTIVVAAALSIDHQTIQAPSRMPGTRSSVASSPVAGLPEAVFLVTKVVDGDTIDVKDSAGNIERVRLVGIDTPETVAPKKKVQCFGPEASAFLKNILLGESVVLEAKPDEDRDEYDRLLRYVFLEREDIGARMIDEGYARSFCMPFPHPKCEEYAALEKSARAEKRGRWGVCAKNL